MSNSNDRLRDHIRFSRSVDSLLPSTHVTDAYSFENIVVGDGLYPMPCPVFGEDLTYLFYGRPSYRAKRTNNTNLAYDWPIVFLLDTDELPKLVRIYPFDTGAFHHGLYKNFFHSGSKLDDFELDSDIGTVKKLVATFYNNNEDYFVGSSRNNFDPDHRQFEVNGLQELSRQPGANDRGITRDERSTSIELQSDAEIHFSNCLRAIILPQVYLGYEDVIEAIERWGVEVIKCYDTVHNTSPDVWAGLIYACTADVYRELGYLKSQSSL